MDYYAAENRYLRRRLSDSIAMANAAAGPCARIAHLTLAGLYRDEIVLLHQQPAVKH